MSMAGNSVVLSGGSGMEVITLVPSATSPPPIRGATTNDVLESSAGRRAHHCARYRRVWSNREADSTRRSPFRRRAHVWWWERGRYHHDDRTPWWGRGRQFRRAYVRRW